MVNRFTSSKRSISFLAGLGLVVLLLAGYLLLSRPEPSGREPLTPSTGANPAEASLPAQPLNPGQPQGVDTDLVLAAEALAEARSAVASTIGGRVTTEDGTSVSAALVEFWPLTEGLLGPQKRTILTNGEGLFELPAETGQAYALRASKDPEGWGWAEPVFAGEVVVLRIGPGATLRVQVLAAPDRNPLEGVTVHATHQPPSGERVVWSSSADSDAEGWAVIAGVPRGYINLRARLTFLGEATSSAESSGKGELQAELLFEGGVTISGRVVDSGGDPVPDTQIGNDAIGTTVTAADGRYALPPAKRVQPIFGLQARHPSFAPATEYLSIENAEDVVTCNFTLQASCSATGRVVDLAGATLPGVQVLARGRFSAIEMTTEEHKTSATTNGFGEYALTGLASDATYFLQVLSDAGSGMTSFRTQTSGPTSVADLVVGPTSSLHGNVYLGQGQERGHARVVLHALPRAGEPGDPRLVQKVPIGPQGNYAFSNLSAGTYSVSMRLGRNSLEAFASHIVALVAGERRTGIDFDLTGARKPPIGGRVTDEYAQPIQSLIVLLQSGGVTIGTCRTAADGTFGFHASPEGKLTLKVQDPRARFNPLEGVPIELDSGAVELTLQPLSTTHSVMGFITDEQGEPVTGVYIALIDLRTGERHGKLGIPDDTGRFQIHNLNPTAYILKSVDYSGVYESFQIDELIPDSGPVKVLLRATQ